MQTITEKVNLGLPLFFLLENLKQKIIIQLPFSLNSFYLLIE